MPIELTGTAFIAAVVLAVSGYIGVEYKRSMHGGTILLVAVEIVAVLLWLADIPGFTEKMMLSTLSFIVLALGVLIVVEEI